MAICKGFSAAFMAAGADQTGANAEPVIQKVILPDSMSTHYVDMGIDKFLNAAGIHRDFGSPSRSTGTAEDRQAQIVAAVREGPAGRDSSHPQGCWQHGRTRSRSLTKHTQHTVRKSSYALLAMVTLGISSAMLAFNRRDLRLRNLCTPTPKRSFEAGSQ